MILIRVAVILALSSVVRATAYIEGEVKQIHLHYHPFNKKKLTTEYSWVVSFIDVFENSVMCTASVILAHMSLTACDCLITQTNENQSFVFDLRVPGDRYIVVGGRVYRKYDNEVEEVETRKFIVHEHCKFSLDHQTWFSNFGLIVHNPFRRAAFLAGPLPTWSSKPDKMELRYQELIASGAPCYLIGWQKNQRRQVRITVKIYYEPLTMVKDDENYSSKCIRASCLIDDLETSQCMQSAVSCTSNRSTLPYNVESGTPLVCGTTGDVYAIAASTSTFAGANASGFGKLFTDLWKLSWAVDWIREETLIELKDRTDVSQYTGLKKLRDIRRKASSRTSRTPPVWKLSMGIVTISTVLFA